MRIAHLTGSWWPPQAANAQQSIRAAEAFVTLGHDVELFMCTARMPRDTSRGAMPEHTLDKRINAILTHRATGRLGGMLYGLRVSMKISRRRHDLAYSRFLWTTLGARLRRVPYMYEVHRPPDGRRAWLERLLTRSSHCRGVVTVSAALRERYEGLLPAHTRCKVIWEGAAASDCCTGDNTIEHGQPSNLGYVGSLFRGRGVDLITQLAQGIPDMTLTVAGAAPTNSTEVAALQAQPNVEMLGFLDQPALCLAYRRFGIALAPYSARVETAGGGWIDLRWTSPLKIAEYMMHGKAIVASNIPPITSVLEHEKTALLVDPDDVRGWLAAVRRLDADPELRARLGQQARAVAVASLTWSARGRRILELVT